MIPDNDLTEHDRFEELCVLSTRGELTPAEAEELHEHLAVCGECRDTLPAYEEFVTAGMAYLASGLTAPAAIDHGPEAEAEMKRKLFARLQTKKVAGRPQAPQVLAYQKWIAIAAIITVAIGLTVIGAYRAGRRIGRTENTGAFAANHLPSDQLTSLIAEKEKLDEQLQLRSKSFDDLTAKARQQAAELARLRQLDAVREAQYSSALTENQQQRLKAGSLSSERDLLARKLQEKEEAFQNLQMELASVREQRQRDLLSSASFEAQIRDLSARLRNQDRTVNQQEAFLASDRDIRELMGARQLYIADVFDVDQNGTKRKPFGRIFYTKGKSLIFYAFDLDQQPGSRNAKAFQVWGNSGEERSKALSLGVFYMDSESNRRWVFKSDDPAVLAQVNAVFVTFEPKGESKTPSGKPFLFAYLRTAPANHP